MNKSFTISGFVAVGMGAALGAWLRWWLGIYLNQTDARFPYGTLVANWGGGYLIGWAVAFFALYPELPAFWRLFAITGFLGGLTTFSTFSAEAMTYLQRADYLNLLLHSMLHLLGSVLLCCLGYASYKTIFSS